MPQGGVEPIRLPLAVTEETRDGSSLRDAKLVNGFVERDGKNTFWVYKRPGISLISTLTGGAYGLGVYAWKNAFYYLVGSTTAGEAVLYKTTDLISSTQLAVLPSPAGNGGVFRFSEYLGATPGFIFSNETVAYYCNGTTATLLPASAPAQPYAQGTVYLDGTTYIMRSSTNGIHGSPINNPSGSWDPTNVIQAYIEADSGVGLAKQISYLVCLKEYSTEVFYDAENATGSPLGRVSGAMLNVGCADGRSFQKLGESLFWMGQLKEGGRSIVRLTKLGYHVISSPYIERILQSADLVSVTSWTAKLAGHEFYVLTLGSPQRTLVYDITNNYWSEWSVWGGNGIDICSATSNTATGSLDSSQVVVQDTTTGNLGYLEMTYTHDVVPVLISGTYTLQAFAIPFDLYTPNFDGGTKLRKMEASLELVADQTTGSEMYVRVSDDDYQTWSDPRYFDLSQERPRLTNWGTFRRRAHHFHHESDTPLRLQYAEMQIQMGTL